MADVVCENGRDSGGPPDGSGTAHVAFEMTAELASPLAVGVGALMTLDGILYGIIEEATGIVDREELRRMVPIQRRHGVFMASRGYWDMAVSGPHVRIGAIRPVADMQDATSFLKGSYRSGIPMVRTTKGRTKATSTQYETVSAREIRWKAVGDPELCRRLLLDAGAIGALRKNGHGIISGVEWEPADPESVLVRNRALTRPIPADTAKDLVGHDGYRAALQVSPWRPPFWDSRDEMACMT